MLLTIHDANLQKVAFIDNDKQGTLNYYNDVWTRNLETGSSTFEFSVFKKAIQSDTALHKTYNALNEKAFISFKYHGKSYVFSVMTVEENEDTIKCYCENLNLELINEYTNPYKATKAMSFVEYCNAMDLLNFTHLTVGINEISDKKLTLEWEGQDTKLARLLSLATKFDAEIDFDTQLNADSTIKSFKVNVYHENDDTHQGVGRVRNDVQLVYGKNLKSITRKIDKTGIYTMVVPTGKRTVKNGKGEEVEEIVTIGSLKPAYSENNKDGVREFYQSGNALYAPIAAQMYPSTFTTGTQADQWIRKDLEVDSDNPTVIRAAGIRNLKKNAYPALSYIVDGFLDVEIGDTIKIYDDAFVPALLVLARVSEQKISFSNPANNKTVFANFKELERNLSTGIQAAFERLFEASKPYIIKLSTDNGVIFKNQAGQTIVNPALYKGGKVISNDVTWRWSLNGNVTTGVTYTVKGSDVTNTVTLTVAAYIGNNEVAVDEITLVNVTDGKNGVKGDKGERGESGSSLRLFTTNYHYNQTLINQYSTDGYIGDWSVVESTTGLKVGDSVQMRVFNTDKQCDSWIVASVSAILGENRIKTVSKGLIEKGSDGAQGIPGKPGTDGKTPYIHFAYAESADGKQGFSTSQTGNKRYIGTYTDYTQADSTDPTKYKWVDMVGTVEVGGRNYIRHYDWDTLLPLSSVVTDWKFERIADPQAKSGYMLKATCTKGGSGGFHKPLVDLRGSGWQDKQMTWSWDMKVSRDMTFTNIGFEMGGLKRDVQITTSWQRISHTFKVTAHQYGYYSCVFYAMNFQVGDIIHLRDPQLEDGIIATTPNAAPEDVEDNINSKADGVLTQEQINALNEKNSIMRAEWEAKASLDTLNKVIAEYKRYTLQNDKDKAQSEKDLVSLNQRLVENIRNLKELAERWNFLDKYFQVGNEGVVFGEQNGNTCAKMSNNRFSIFSAGTEVMYISQGTLFIKNGIFSKSIQIGRFREEQYHLNLDMNVIRYVGGV